MSVGVPKKLLVAVDYSPASSGALSAALGFATALGAEVHVAFVTPAALPPSIGSALPGNPVGHNLFALMRQEAEEQLAAFVNRHHPGATMPHLHVLSGDPRLELIDCARQIAADWIAVGSQGSSAFNRWLLGSVAEYLLRHSPVPVLLVPGPRPSEEAQP